MDEENLCKPTGDKAFKKSLSDISVMMIQGLAC